MMTLVHIGRNVRLGMSGLGIPVLRSYCCSMISLDVLTLATILICIQQAAPHRHGVRCSEPWTRFPVAVHGFVQLDCFLSNAVACGLARYSSGERPASLPLGRACEVRAQGRQRQLMHDPAWHQW